MAKRNQTIRVSDDAEALEKDLAALQERVRRRAFEISQSASSSADPQQNWLRAESELVWRAPVRCREMRDAYVLEIAVPGLRPDEIEVRLAGGRMIVRGARHRELRESDERMVWCEYTGANLFREVTLPLDTRIEKAKAQLNDGVLSVKVPRAAAVKARKKEDGRSAISASTDGAATKKSPRAAARSPAPRKSSSRAGRARRG